MAVVFETFWQDVRYAMRMLRRSLIPAVRAVRLDPIKALRIE